MLILVTAMFLLPLVLLALIVGMVLYYAVIRPTRPSNDDPQTY